MASQQQSQPQARPSGGRYVGQSDDDRALQRLTGHPHTIYRPVLSLFTKGRVYETMGGKRFICEGSGESTVARWI